MCYVNVKMLLKKVVQLNIHVPLQVQKTKSERGERCQNMIKQNNKSTCAD